MKHNIVRVRKENYHLFDDMVYWRVTGEERNLKEKELLKNTQNPPPEISYDELYVYAVEYENKFIAWLSMMFMPKVGIVNRKGFVYVEELWVEPSYRRMGIAKILMKEADDFMNKLQATGIRLGVNIDNPSALKLYESCGYKSTGQAFTMEKGIK